MSALVSPVRRQEIPDPQIRDAADQFEAARQFLDSQTGVLCPLMNTAAVAIELYLKCLSAERVWTDAGRGWSKVSAKPEFGHGLIELLDKVGDDLQNELDRAFQSELTALGVPSFRAALQDCEGVFQASRYPFEKNRDISRLPLTVVMRMSRFLHQFVFQLQTRQIHWLEMEPEDAR